MLDSTPCAHDRADSVRQVAANELRRLGFRVPCLKTTPVTSAKQTFVQGTLRGWPLFGVDIAEQPQQVSHLLAGLIVPWFLDESLRVLLSHASTEGILRKSGSLSRQRLLRTSLESSASLGVASVVLASAPIHDVSGLLKHWLRLLPEPLLPKPLVQLLLRCQAKHGLEAVLLALQLLPNERLACLRHLLVGLAQLATHPGNLMGAHNLATVLAPTLCCPATVQSAAREELESLVSLVQALIDASHLVGSTLPPLPGREGRKKTNSACLLLHQLRRLVAQRKVPEAEAVDEQDCSSTASSNGPTIGSKRLKPRELLPRGLSPWKRAKREEGLPSRQQQANTPELLDSRPCEVTPSAVRRKEVSMALYGAAQSLTYLQTLPVHEQSAAKLQDSEVTASMGVVNSGATVFYTDKPPACPEQPAAPVDPLVPQTVHFLRGGSCTSSTKSSLRRGRPNSLRSGLPSLRPLRHGPETRRHSSTGSKPPPPVGKENLQRSLRYASQENCVFNAPAMAHLAAVKARREMFMAQCLAKNPTISLDMASPQLLQRSSSISHHPPLEPVVEAPPVLAEEPQLPAEGQVGTPCTEMGQEEDEPMDTDTVPDTTSPPQDTTGTSSPLQETAPNAVIFCKPQHSAVVQNEGLEQTTVPEISAMSSASTSEDTTNVAEPVAWSDSFFALPAVPPAPPEPESSAAKRESIIQIRERNAGKVRSSVEVFNRVAAASSAVVPQIRPAVRARRAVVGRSAPARQSSDPTSCRPPLREANFQAPANPRTRTRQEHRRDWEIEL